MVEKATARRHHFVPQAYLAGFTDSGKKDGQIYVVEVKTGRAFRTSPKNIAVETDFNRIDVEGYPPDFIENALSPLEQSAVQAIACVAANGQFPSDADYSAILHLLALLFIRNPGMRESFNASREHSIRIMNDLLISNEKTFRRQIERARAAGIDLPENVSYEEIRRFVKSNEYEIEFHPQSNLRVELGMLEKTLRLLHERTWSLISVPDGLPDFICSDHPVTLVHKSGRNIPVGLATRNTDLFFPLSRRFGFYGVFEQTLKPVVDAKHKNVAILNGYVASNAMKHLYSTAKEFLIWGNNEIQIAQVRI
ncbi:MAG: DUF4238 domain-containing protein [Burkholderiales bacterium]|nr:DUF4238 domain-containing protein [Burkholderiales bacterium]